MNTFTALREAGIMNLTRILMHAVLHFPFLFRKMTGTGAFGLRKAIFLRSPPSTGGNALKAALIAHHEKQFHEASCSVATIVSSINAVRTIQNGSAHRINQMEILEKVNTGNWKERMSEGGHNGRRGLPLYLLGEVVKSSFDAYGLRYLSVDVVQALKASASVPIRETLLRRLKAFEEMGDRLIIAHFDQGAFLPVLNIPHISPVGGFDLHTGMVTLLDVVPSQERPYKIDFDTFYKGLSSNYWHIFRPFGYDNGGYVHLKLSRD